jgi:hypothetical protein
MRNRDRHPDAVALTPEALTPEERAELELESRRALADPYGDLRRAADQLGELLKRQAARPRALHRRIRLDATRPFVDFVAQHGHPWLSVLVENPNAAAGQNVEVGFAAGTGLPGQSDTRVPRQTGKLIPVRAEAVSVGMDPAVVGGGVELFVVLYDELLPPTSYALAL